MNPRRPRAIKDLSSLDTDTVDPFILEELDVPPIEESLKSRRGWPLGRILLSTISILVMLAIGLWTDNLIRNLFAQSGVLGWVALICALLAALVIVILVGREIISIYRLEKQEKIRIIAHDALEQDDPALARKAVSQLLHFTANQPLVAKGRHEIHAAERDIIDGRAMIHLGENLLLAPLDRQARTIVMSAAKRVSLVTAISPRAIIDMIYVIYETSRMVRRLATLYGCRPGKLGAFIILRRVFTHLAVTGTLALSDGLAQQLIGHSLASRLSRRLGEGVVNGLMTTRIGIAAIDALRPFPFDGEKRPGMADFTTDLVKFSRNNAADS